MATALGEKIRTERKRRKLTLDQLAEQTGSSKSYIWELENRPVVRPSAEKIAKVGEVLGLTVEYLLDDEKHEPTESDSDKVFFRRFSRLDPKQKEKLQSILSLIEDD